MKNFKKLCLLCIMMTCSLSTSDLARAHFPWLASDDAGHVMMWFGESTDDRTYPMPEKIQAIRLANGTSENVIETQSIESDDFVGIRSKAPVDSKTEISGVVTYGLYHGTKLTYHVEHLPQSNSAQWPSQSRPSAVLQTLVNQQDEGGIRVTVIAHGKPLADTSVKLFSDQGHEEAARDTDANGVVQFTGEEVQPGLNALMVGLTDPNAKGVHDGESYTSTSDYLTSTFTVARASADSPSSSEKNEPILDPNSTTSIAASGLPNLPEELTSFGAAVANQKVYVYGGHTGGAHSYSTDEQSDRFWCLDLAAGNDGAWVQLPSGPSLQGLALVAHGDRIIRVGGFTAMNQAGEDHDLRSQDSVAAYDTRTKAWTDLPSLPEARSSLDAAVLESTLYVFGGWKLDGENDDSDWHQTAWSLDLEHDDATWQPLAEPPFQRRAISVAAHNGKLFVIGGMTSDGKPTTRVEIYDPSSNQWVDGPALPGSGMAGFGSSSFATGGGLYVSTMDGFVHRISADQNAWTTIAKSDPARFFHRMLPDSDHSLLMIGGANMQVGKFTQIDRIELGRESE